MSRYIDAEETKKVIRANEWTNPTVPDAVAIIINHMPTADVAPVVHAHWVKKDCFVHNSDGEPVMKIGEYYICSNCGLEENDEYEYCHCGAKMDEESII